MLKMKRLVRGAAGRASGAGRPSPVGSPPPHRSRCSRQAGGKLGYSEPPSAWCPGPSARRERGFWRGQSGGREQQRRAAGRSGVVGWGVMTSELFL